MGALPGQVETLVIGAGFGGLAMYRRLVDAGLSDFVIVERAAQVGGTWRDNTYPGCACDVESHVYEFAAAPNPDWSRTYGTQPEIQDYLTRVAADWNVVDRTVFNCAVQSAEWDETKQHWRIRTSLGETLARVLIAAPGGLSAPRAPELPGVFGGRFVHTARWPKELDLTGQSVVVIGTGASAIQVVPHIAKQAARLTVLQRTPAWILPKNDFGISEETRQRYRRWPSLLRAARRRAYLYREAFGRALQTNSWLLPLLERQAIVHLHRQVKDPTLWPAFTPDYRLGCKRVLLSNDFYPTFNRGNVALVPHAAAGFTEHGVQSVDGVEYPADVVVLATGFEVLDHPLLSVIRGRSQTLAEAVDPQPEAYLGMSISGFPNFFWLGGPNTGGGHTSVVLNLEAQAKYIAQALLWCARADVSEFEIHSDVVRRYNAALDRKLAGSVWTQGGCRSWYQADNGRVAAIWPGSTARFRKLTRQFDPAVYATN